MALPPPRLKRQSWQHLSNTMLQQVGFYEARNDVLPRWLSNFRHRASLPRSSQTLFSRWRLGQVESCGTYPRKLKWVEQSNCRFCSSPCETTFHLLTTSPGATTTRAYIGVSLDALCCDTAHNVIAIAHFDTFIRSVLPYASPSPLTSLVLTSLLKAIAQQKRPLPTSNRATEPPRKRHREDANERQRLVIPLQPPPPQPLDTNNTPQ